MSEKAALFENDQRCHVCSETFRDPVSLSCNHSFCSSCLQQSWEQAKNKNCPICERPSSKEPPWTNFALKDLNDSSAKRQKSGSSNTDSMAGCFDECSGSPVKKIKKEEVVCSEHEEPQWSCKNEARVVCTVCEICHHQNHTVVPGEEAVSDLKQQLKSDLKSLQDKKNKYKQEEETYNEMFQHSKKQLLSTERKILEDCKREVEDSVSFAEMSEKAALLENYLSCHVCSETFRDPVSLSCNHSFCSSCLQQFWEQAENKNCPICERPSSKGDPPVNFGLKALADSFAGKQKSGSSETEKQHEKQMVVCTKHKEEPRLFCKDEARLMCTVCDFPHHHSHTVVPVEEAVSDLKQQLKSDLKSLQDKKNKYKQVEETYNEMFQHSKKQLLSTERQIRAEFNKLHQLLKEEEESRLAALREEEEQKGKTMSREMKMIEEQISSLSDRICAVEEELQKDKVAFLSSYKATQTRARAQCSVSDPQLLSGALTDVAKHLGNLSFRVWEKIKEKLHFTPVILDSNTVHPRLHLSDDLTSVRCGDTRQQLPDNPERFTKYPNVMGSEGFSSGKHSWEVEVGDHPVWNVGLVKESVDRKGECSASPKHGVWCLCHYDGKYTNSVGKTLTVKKSLQKIRVQLDYDMGEVSFYVPEDMTHIYTHRDTFTEKLFPYFSVGKSGNAKTSDIKVCPTEISV